MRPRPSAETRKPTAVRSHRGCTRVPAHKSTSSCMGFVGRPTGHRTRSSRKVPPRRFGDDAHMPMRVEAHGDLMEGIDSGSGGRRIPLEWFPRAGHFAAFLHEYGSHRSRAARRGGGVLASRQDRPTPAGLGRPRVRGPGAEALGRRRRRAQARRGWRSVDLPHGVGPTNRARSYLSSHITCRTAASGWILRPLAIAAAIRAIDLPRLPRASSASSMRS